MVHLCRSGTILRNKLSPFTMGSQKEINVARLMKQEPSPTELTQQLSIGSLLKTMFCLEGIVFKHRCRGRQVDRYIDTYNEQSLLRNDVHVCMRERETEIQRETDTTKRELII